MLVPVLSAVIIEMGPAWGGPGSDPVPSRPGNQNIVTADVLSVERGRRNVMRRGRGVTGAAA